MKLRNELKNIEDCFRKHRPEIEQYAPKLREHGKYNDFNTRLTWDCLNAFIGIGAICKWYDKYNCHDNHITTVGAKALSNIGIIRYLNK